MGEGENMSIEANESAEALVKAALWGDAAAFQRLVAEQKMKMYSIAFSYLKNETDALEAIQETVCRPISSRESSKSRIFSIRG